MPLLSVIIPVYNAEKYLHKCISSVLNQNLKDIEVILVDDGSTDNSLNIIKAYKEADSRVKFITQKQLYAGVARNNGLKVANGKFIHFLDSDDFVSKDGYRKIIDLMESRDLEFIKFKNKCLDERSHKVIYDKFVNLDKDSSLFNKKINIRNNFKRVLFNIPDNPWSGIYKRELLTTNSIKFDNLFCCNDTSFFIKLLLCAKNIYVSDEFVIYHRKNVDNSLIQKRILHFDCQFDQYKIIMEIIDKEEETVKALVRQRLIYNLFHFFKKFLKESLFDEELHKEIIKKLREFILKNNIDPTSLNRQNYANLCKGLSRRRYIYISDDGLKELYISNKLIFRFVNFKK